MAKMPRRALVIGASMVGIKAMELFHEAGVRVCLADKAPHLFPLAAHPECARVMEEHLEQRGIKLKLGGGIERVEDTAAGVRAYFKDSPEAEEADLLVMCIGVRANTGFIDPKQVAVDKGVLVDERMRTSRPGLYAAGDVAQGRNLLSGGSQIIGLWANARYQGRTAGRNMAGGNDFFPGNIPHFISTFMGMDFVSVGDVTGHDRTEKRYDGKRYLQLFWREGRLTGANLVDRVAESGPIKSALIKGLGPKGTALSGFQPAIQNHVMKSILREVGVA
jgi:NADPH-dependent 2,4-dienoyl-CoA reductase/sulfur reductase-like enzyme